MSIITMKFGGTSVGSAGAISHVVDIVRQSVMEGDQVIVVVSAMSGITDALLNSVKAAENGDKWGYRSLSARMREQHEEAINRLLKPSSEREDALRCIHKLLDQHLELCDAITILGEITDRILDHAVSFGERMSSLIVSAALREREIRSKAFNAGDLIFTDGVYQSATPKWQETEANIQEKLIPAIEKGIVPVITGFIGSTDDGSYTTLGRGGSDYSAAIFAAYVNSDAFIVWTDVDGVMTTDPRIDRRAQVLAHVSYQEVGEMAFYGAKVLHPKTVQPIINHGIPIYVRNTFNPAHQGTLISHEAEESDTVIKAVTCVENVSLLTVSGAGMLGVPGIAGRSFLATANAGANILMISQASSEQSFCFSVLEHQAETVKASVEAELASEIEQRNVDGVHIRNDVGIITVIGAGMRGSPGVAGRVFTCMGQANASVLAIAQGSSECSISFIVSDADLKRATIALHELVLAEQLADAVV